MRNCDRKRARRGWDHWLCVWLALGVLSLRAVPAVAFKPSLLLPVVEVAFLDPGLTVASASIRQQVLAPEPMCEGSAAVEAPWDDGLILVADNEISKQLFGFEIDDGILTPDVVLATQGRRPRDVEALARSGTSLLLVGSHSRNSKCEERTNRQRLRWVKSRTDGTLEGGRLIDGEETWRAARGSQAACLGHLFANPAPQHAGIVCQALLLAEERATLSPPSCETLNIEGAFGTETNRIWLGLRAPLVEGKAIVMRLALGLSELRFDRVTLLDLGGHGIRELSLANGTLYGIAGPAPDSTVPFGLFSADVDDVTSGGELVPTVLRTDLPTSSEGMVINNGMAFIVIDGDEGSASECEQRSKQYSLELP